MMKFLLPRKTNAFIFSAVALFCSSAMGAASHTYSCDSKDEIGTIGRLTIQLGPENISLVHGGTTMRVYDAQTICGWSPTAGLDGITCPFATQTTDKSLSVDLKCYSGDDPNANVVTSGSLLIQDGAGSLMCNVYNARVFQLTLSNCQGQ